MHSQCATITSIWFQNIFIIIPKGNPVPIKQPHPINYSPAPWQPLICFSSDSVLRALHARPRANPITRNIFLIIMKAAPWNRGSSLSFQIRWLRLREKRFLWGHNACQWQNLGLKSPAKGHVQPSLVDNQDLRSHSCDKQGIVLFKWHLNLYSSYCEGQR